MIEYLIILVISTLPWIELRGAIPIGILLYGLNPALVFTLAVIANIAVFFPINFGLSKFYDAHKDKEIVKKTVDRVRKKAGPHVDKFGVLGLATFVAIPLPVTGAWTGTLFAWLLGMEKKKAFLAIAAGVIVAGVVVTILTLFAAEILYSLGVPRPI